MAEKMIVVASNKGGVGKTTMAIELAYGLGAVLVDLDDDEGGATYEWPEVGQLAPESARRALLEGDGPGPRVLNRDGLPAFVPAHPAYADNPLPVEVVAERLDGWRKRLPGTLVVVDTHPGFDPLTVGAMVAADAVLVPVLLEERPLRAFARMAATYSEYRLIAVPWRVRRWGDYQQAAVKPLYETLSGIGQRHELPVAPFVSEWREWPLRRTRRSLLSAREPGKWTAEAQGELRRLSEWVGREVGLHQPVAANG